ncbi:SCP-2 sterol transfer family protein [Brevibacillus borstelensis]|uniref:SCP-2 sterol transfer family protein n=1 Tax=Brevibacillus borstelensis TaxID=45462 RepID=UPI0030C3EFAC
MAGGSLDRLLERVAGQIAGKAYLKSITGGWERCVGIVAEDAQSRHCLRFTRSGIASAEWQEPVHLIVSGQERDLQRLFAGDELLYVSARQSVSIKGPLRDQLKLDALLRLACS